MSTQLEPFGICFGPEMDAVRRSLIRDEDLGPEVVYEDGVHYFNFGADNMLGYTIDMDSIDHTNWQQAMGKLWLNPQLAFGITSHQQIQVREYERSNAGLTERLQAYQLAYENLIAMVPADIRDKHNQSVKGKAGAYVDKKKLH